MNIQYYGHSCFKITTKPEGRGNEEINMFFDPFDKEIGLKPPQGQADIIFVSHSHSDHSNIDSLKGEPIVIDTPGEFVVKGVSVVGIDSFHDTEEGAQRGRNTIFIVETEEIRICHMGDLGATPSPDHLEKIGEVDVLMIPVGGKVTIDGKEAVSLIQKLEPKIVIPIHYKTPELSLDLDDEKYFCEEMGNCPKEKVNKLTIKKPDLEGKNMETVLMSAQ